MKTAARKRPKRSFVQELRGLARQLLDDMAALPNDLVAFFRARWRPAAGNGAPPPPGVRPDGAAAGGNGAYARTEGRQGVLAVVGLEKSFKARQVVQGVSLAVRRGEAVGLLGPNGAGKTTCFYMITGLIRPDSGRIELDGYDITDTPMYQRARLGIGYLPQEASIFRGLSVENNIRAVLEIVEPSQRERERQLDALLDEFSITHLRKMPCDRPFRRRTAALSKSPGRWPRARPSCCSTSLSPASTRSRSATFSEFVRHLTSRGIGVLITDHNVRETLGLIDRAYIIASRPGSDPGRAGRDRARPDVRRHIWRTVYSSSDSGFYAARKAGTAKPR